MEGITDFKNNNKNRSLPEDGAYGMSSLSLGTGSSSLGTGSSSLGTGSSSLGTGLSSFGTGSSSFGTGSSSFGTGSSSLGTSSSLFNESVVGLSSQGVAEELKKLDLIVDGKFSRKIRKSRDDDEVDLPSNISSSNESILNFSSDIPNFSSDIPNRSIVNPIANFSSDIPNRSIVNPIANLPPHILPSVPPLFNIGSEVGSTQRFLNKNKRIKRSSPLVSGNTKKDESRIEDFEYEIPIQKNIFYKILNFIF